MPKSESEEKAYILEAIEETLFSQEDSDAIAQMNKEEIDWRAEHTYLNYQNRVDKAKKREEWDVALRNMVIGGFILSYVIIILIGLEILKFGDNAFAVPSVVAAGVLQTYGLAKLAIKYFFSEDAPISKR